MTARTRFAESAKVIILDSQHRFVAATYVSEVRQRTLKTANGQTWDLDGFYRSGSRSWPFPRIVLPAEGEGKEEVGAAWSAISPTNNLPTLLRSALEVRQAQDALTIAETNVANRAGRPQTLLHQRVLAERKLQDALYDFARLPQKDFEWALETATALGVG